MHVKGGLQAFAGIICLMRGACTTTQLGTSLNPAWADMHDTRTCSGTVCSLTMRAPANLPQAFHQAPCHHSQLESRAKLVPRESEWNVGLVDLLRKTTYGDAREGGGGGAGGA